MDCKHFAICELEAIDSEGLCILHSYDPEKDKEEFQKAMNDRLGEKNYNFRLFVFPKRTYEFKDITFEDNVDFRSASFQGSAHFFWSTFVGMADFRWAIFKRDAYFGGVTFQKNASFNGANFHGDVAFSISHKNELSGKKTSRETIFQQGADFSGATFKERAVFIGGEGRLFSMENETLFLSTNLEKSERVSFKEVNLNRCRFLGTPLRYVGFVDAKRTYLRTPRWLRILDSDRIGVFDEIGAKKKDFPFIEDLYRELKMNFEERGNHEAAGEFHFGEKEMRRKATGFRRDPILWFYWLLSGYSERGGRTRSVVWLLILWLVGAYIYKITGFNDIVPKSYHFFHSLKTIFLPQIPEGHFQSFIGSWVEVIQSILGKIQIALIILSLRQRLRR
jgi:uncharacterized protein YjbI with pentapeptide repeats